METHEPEEDELTPEEVDACLKAARIAKAYRRKTQAYWQRINQPVRQAWTPDQLGSWILDESKRYDEQDMNPRYIGPDGWLLDEHSEPIFDLLCMYFTNHPDFEKANELYDQFKDGRFSLEKGIMLVGPTGIGKSRLLRLFCDNPRESFKITKCSTAVNTYESAERTADALVIYENLTSPSDPKNYRFRHGLGGRAFDDLGTETIPAVHFKKERNLMLDVLDRRYDMGTRQARLTHLATNLTFDQVETMYGRRIRSRMREMFNVIKFDPKTPDRRK